MSRVLLVDDDTDALELRKLIFEHHGHAVIAVNSAAGARRQFHAAPPESVILDLRLPDAADGLALIREFRASSPQVKIVVVSGWRADLDGRTEGDLVDVILAKPVRSEILLRAIT